MMHLFFLLFLHSLHGTTNASPPPDNIYRCLGLGRSTVKGRSNKLKREANRADDLTSGPVTCCSSCSATRALSGG